MRLLILTSAALASACSGTPERLGASDACPPARMLICEDFGPENRCRCADAHALGRALGRLGVAVPAAFDNG